MAILLFLMLAAGLKVLAADVPQGHLQATNPPTLTSTQTVKVVTSPTQPKFTKDQVTRRLKELKELRDRGLILQDFYDRKVKECEVTP
ncbi:MAG: hypothetical protein WCO42_10715 [bacterium]